MSPKIVKKSMAPPIPMPAFCPPLRFGGPETVDVGLRSAALRVVVGSPVSCARRTGGMVEVMVVGGCCRGFSLLTTFRACGEGARKVRWLGVRQSVESEAQQDQRFVWLLYMMPDPASARGSIKC